MHSLNSKLDDLFRLLVHHLSQSCGLESAYIIGMSVVDLLIQLLACHFNLVSVYNDYKIACIDMRSENRLILSS